VKPLFHEIAMVFLTLQKKISNICVLVLKVYIMFTYVHVCVHVCYVVVNQVGEGAPIPFWLVVFSIKTCNLTMK